jgi:hypothetical protein
VTNSNDATTSANDPLLRQAVEADAATTKDDTLVRPVVEDDAAVRRQVSVDSATDGISRRHVFEQVSDDDAVMGDATTNMVSLYRKGFAEDADAKVAGGAYGVEAGTLVRRQGRHVDAELVQGVQMHANDGTAVRRQANVDSGTGGHRSTDSLQRLAIMETSYRGQQQVSRLMNTSQVNPLHRDVIPAVGVSLNSANAKSSGGNKSVLAHLHILIVACVIVCVIVGSLSFRMSSGRTRIFGTRECVHDVATDSDFTDPMLYQTSSVFDVYENIKSGMLWQLRRRFNAGLVSHFFLLENGLSPSGSDIGGPITSLTSWEARFFKLSRSDYDGLTLSYVSVQSDMTEKVMTVNSVDGDIFKIPVDSDPVSKQDSLSLARHYVSELGRNDLHTQSPDSLYVFAVHGTPLKSALPDGASPNLERKSSRERLVTDVQSEDSDGVSKYLGSPDAAECEQWHGLIRSHLKGECEQ